MNTILQRARDLFSRSVPFYALNRDLKLIFVSNLMAALGDGFTIYLLPIYIRSLGATPTDVGLLFSILTLASAVTIIPGGILADKYDRKKIMVLGWAMWVPVPLMFAFATHWTQLFSAMFIFGILLSGPATSAYIVTLAHRDKIMSTFTMMSSIWAMGYAFSSSVGGYLAKVIGMQRVFFLTFIFYSITIGILCFISSQHTAPANSQKQISSTLRQDSTQFNYKKVLFISALFATMLFILHLVGPFVTQFMSDVLNYNTAQIGLLGAFTYVGSSILALGLGRIGDKKGENSAISVSMGVTCLSLAIFVSFKNFFAVAIASFLRGVSTLFPIRSLLDASVGSITPPESRARWISVAQTTCELTSIIAPYFGGVLYSISPYTPFLLAIAATLVLSILALTKPFKK